jgi:hypothetical protein
MTAQIGRIITGSIVSLAAALTGCQPGDIETSRTRGDVAAQEPKSEVLLGDTQPAEREARLTGVVTSLAFNHALLGDLGVKVTDLEATGAGPQHALAILPDPAVAFKASAAAHLQVRLLEGRFLDFSGGSVSHAGGPTLRGQDQAISLAGFEVRPGPEPQSLELLTATGESLFYATLPHYEVHASGVFDLFNADLQLTDALAARWKRPDLAGLVVGTLTLRGDIEGWSPSEIPAAPPVCGDWSGEPDVALISMTSVQQTFRSDGRVVITPSATLKNVGTANVSWNSKFSGVFQPFNNDQHPFLVWAIYRETSGILEMIGKSDVKHAFLTINVNCDEGACRQGNILGLGCEDVYSVGTNSGHLGPRSEITPNAGVWAHCNEPQANTPSHYDQVAPFCSQDNTGSNESPFEHRLVVDDADLSVAGAKYFFASWYVVRGDKNLFNNIGWRQLTPAFSGSAWSFAFATAFKNGSVLDAWVNPAAPEPGSATAVTDDPDAGAVQVAVKTIPLARGFYRYVYTVHNHDFDPSVDSFRIPLAPGVTVSRLRFHDFDDNLTTDWTATVAPGDAITWTAPSAGARLGWGTMYTFSFVANTPPVAGVTQVTRPDTAGVVSVSSLGVGSSGTP